MPSNTVRGPVKPLAISAARNPDCAAQPACMRLVHAPSARYSMMPDAILPAMPSAFDDGAAVEPERGGDACRRAIAPKTAVGWKPALCTSFGVTSDSRHMVSTPAAMPRSAAAPSGRWRSQAASTAGTMTAPACTGPPSKVSSKSSPWAAVPLTSAAATARQRAPMADRRARAVVIAGRERARDVIEAARGQAEADHVDR